jgi:hypothetical protein
MQPGNLNEIYLLANQWVKLVTRGNTKGFASKFHTMLDKTKRTRGNQPKDGGKQKGGKQKSGKQQQIQKQRDGGNKKDPSSASLVASWGIMPTSVRRGREQKMAKMRITTGVLTSQGMQIHLQLTKSRR